MSRLSILLPSLLLSSLLTGCQLGARQDLGRAIEQAHAIEQQERATYAQAVTYFQSRKVSNLANALEIPKVNGVMKTDEAGLHVARLVRDQGPGPKAAHAALRRAAARYGLENWLHTATEAIDPAWLPSIFEAAVAAPLDPSPFLQTDEERKTLTAGH